MPSFLQARVLLGIIKFYCVGHKNGRSGCKGEILQSLIYVYSLNPFIQLYLSFYLFVSASSCKT